MESLGGLWEIVNYHLTLRVSHLCKGGLVNSLSLMGISLGVIEGDSHSHHFTNLSQSLGHFLSRTQFSHLEETLVEIRQESDF